MGGQRSTAEKPGYEQAVVGARLTEPSRQVSRALDDGRDRVLPISCHQPWFLYWSQITASASAKFFAR